ncbi:MAG: site-specific integrase [Bacteroidales bacterium]|nr:site-specific integrase [Bacteroidales bacterium]
MNLNTYITAKPFLRSDYTTKDNTKIIYIRITIPNNYLVFSTGINVMPKNWNKKIIHKNDPECFEKNKRLKMLILKAQKIIDKYFFEDKTLTKEIFKSEFFTPNKILFFDWAYKELEKMTIGYGTRKAYKSKLNIFKKYIGNIYIAEITSKMLEQYRTSLMSTSQNENSANKSLGILKVFLNIAQKQALIEKNPFENVKIKEIKGNRKPLLINQLEKLENLKLTGKAKIILNQFLFACYTGLSYSDIYELSDQHIFEENFNDKQGLIIRKNRLKTNNAMSIPLIPKAANIYKNGDLNYKFTNQYINREIKKIAKDVGIENKVTFHVARHTFATISLNKGIPIEVVSDLLGHTQIKTTKIYTKINDDYKFFQMQKLINK